MVEAGSAEGTEAGQAMTDQGLEREARWITRLAEAEARARMAEAQRNRMKEALQEVRSDIARAVRNDVIWPSTIRLIDEALAEVER